MARRKHGAEFKREAVKLAERAGVAQTQVARELGIHPNLLRNWIRQFDSGRWETLLPTSNLVVNFGASRVTATLNVQVEAVYTVVGSNLPIAGSGFSSALGGATTVTAGRAGACSTSIDGFFAGANAARAGVSYSIKDSLFGQTAGAAEFKRQGF